MINSLVDDLVELHFLVLKQIFKEKKFSAIEQLYSAKMKELNYITLAKANNLLTFDENGSLIGAYPVSPLKTNFKVTVDGIGSSYCMCAVDSLGIAYTFGKKTTIESKDSTTNQPIVITVDPVHDKIETNVDYFVTYKEPDEVQNIALDQCPVINFYSDKNSVKDKSLIVFTFSEAVKHAKDIFSPEAFKKSFSDGFDSILNEKLS